MKKSVQRLLLSFFWVLLGACLLALGVSLWQQFRLPEPPAADETAGGDPLVSALIRKSIADVREHPTDVARRLGLGMVYEANGRPRLALRCYEQAVSLRGDQPRFWYHVALVRARLGDVDGALEAVDEALRLQPDHAPSYWRRGLWLLERGESGPALAAFEKATEVDPDDPHGWYGTSRAFLQRNDPRGAADVLEELLAKHPDDRYARFLLGRAYVQIGQKERARAELAQGSQLMVWRDPWADEVSRLRTGYLQAVREANRLMASGQIEQSIALLEELLPHWPTDVKLLNMLGSRYVEVEQYEKGVKLLEKAAEHHPDDYTPLLNLAAAYLKKGDTARAAAQLDRSLTFDPEPRWKVRRLEGMIRSQQGNHEGAVRAFNAGIRALETEAPVPETGETVVDRPRAKLLVGIALARMELGATGDAAAALERAEKLSPEDPEVEAAKRRLKSLEDSSTETAPPRGEHPANDGP